MQGGEWRFSALEDGLAGTELVLGGFLGGLAWSYLTWNSSVWLLIGAVAAAGVMILGACRLVYERDESLCRYLTEPSLTPLVSAAAEAWINGELGADEYFTLAEARAAASAERDIMCWEYRQPKGFLHDAAHLIGEAQARLGD